MNLVKEQRLPQNIPGMRHGKLLTAAPCNKNLTELFSMNINQLGIITGFLPEQIIIHILCHCETLNQFNKNGTRNVLENIRLKRVKSLESALQMQGSNTMNLKTGFAKRFSARESFNR